MKSVAAANSRGRQWHPLVISWCLYLHHLSSKSYETIRKSRIVNLPSSRTPSIWRIPRLDFPLKQTGS